MWIKVNPTTFQVEAFSVSYVDGMTDEVDSVPDDLIDGMGICHYTYIYSTFTHRLQSQIDDECTSVQNESCCKTAFFFVGRNTNEFLYGVRQVGFAENDYFSFVIPPDLRALGEILLCGFPDTTEDNASIDLYSNYCFLGEQGDANAETDTSINFDLVAGQLVELDVSSVFTGVQKNHYCGLKIDHNLSSGNINYMHIKINYST